MDLTTHTQEEIEAARSRGYAMYAGEMSFDIANPILPRVVAVGPAGLTEDEFALWQEEGVRMGFDPHYDPAHDA